MSFNVKLNVTPALDLLRRIRRSVDAIGDVVKEAVSGPIHERVVEDVDTLIATYPAEGDTRNFRFASEASRNYYLMARRKGYFPSQAGDVNDAGPWQRTDNLRDSWKVELDPRSTRVNTIMRIYNDARSDNVDPRYPGEAYSGAVYGPDQVPGFINLGWGVNLDSAIDEITDNVNADLTDALDRAIREFRSGNE